MTNKADMFNINFYQFQCPDEILKNVVEIIHNDIYRRNEYNTIGNRLKHIDLETFLNQCFDQIIEDRFKGIAYSLRVTSMWSNKSNKLQFHHKHHHPNSILSGILYLNEGKGFGKTQFYYKDPYWHVHNHGFLKIIEKENEVEMINAVEPESGKIIIFPSTIVHSTTPHKNSEPRFSVAFNSFFRGTLNKQSIELSL